MKDFCGWFYISAVSLFTIFFVAGMWFQFNTNFIKPEEKQKTVEVHVRYGLRDALIENGCSIMKCGDSNFVEHGCECLSWDNAVAIPVGEVE